MSAVVVTSSYRGDLERCRLLCDSIDARLSGHTRHLIAVEPRDVTLFRPLAGPKREIVDERDLFPWWLRTIPDPMTFGRRSLWISPKGLPLHGWHAQQLRRIALGTVVPESTMITIDSDVVFLRAVDAGMFRTADGKTFFYRRPHGVETVVDEYRASHYEWSRKAGELLGIEAPAETATGYIYNLVTWATASVRDMMGRIEAVTGRDAMSALCATRSLSECTIFGRYIDEIEGIDKRHAEINHPFAATYWDGPNLGERDLRSFVEATKPNEVALGVQSFTRTDTSLIRRVVGL